LGILGTFILLGCGVYFYRNSISSFVQEKESQSQNQIIYGEFVSCVNKNENMTLMNVAETKNYQNQNFNLMAVVITTNLPTDINSALYQKRFADAYKNLFSCSLKLNSWDILQILYFKFYTINTVDDGQKLHYYAQGLFFMNISKDEVNLLSNDENFIKDMEGGISSGIIPVMDLSNQQAIFEKKNPIGDVQLALKRYLKYLEQLKSSSGLGV